MSARAVSVGLALTEIARRIDRPTAVVRSVLDSELEHGRITRDAVGGTRSWPRRSTRRRCERCRRSATTAPRTTTPTEGGTR